MTKEDARSATVSKFTNLWDGSVLRHASVSTIIDHYEALLAGAKPARINDHSHFIQNFIEEAVNEIENEYYLDQDDYPGL
jgi:hypothetical protein